jgi:1,4-dihydroxy-2-naphthoyl-CoA hydrolase
VSKTVFAGSAYQTSLPPWADSHWSNDRRSNEALHLVLLCCSCTEICIEMSTAAPPRLSVKRKHRSMRDKPSEVSMSEFMRIAGLRLEEVSGSRVRGSIEFGEHHHTPWGVVHGGVYTSAVESAASVGASAAVEEKEQFAVGVSNNTDFLRPMKEGRVDVVAEPIIQGQLQQLWQVIITRSADGKEVARGQVRLQNIALPS